MKQTECRKIEPMLPDYADGVLPETRLTAVSSHLKQCPECRLALQAQAEAQRLLQRLPQRRLSADFDTRLAERMAEAKAKATHSGWKERAAAWLAPRHAALKPALAFCAALIAVTGVSIYLQPPTPRVQHSSPAVNQSDASLISHCVAIHRSDVAVQPLSDWSAQNLADQVDPSSGTLAVSKDRDDETL